MIKNQIRLISFLLVMVILTSCSSNNVANVETTVLDTAIETTENKNLIEDENVVDENTVAYGINTTADEIYDSILKMDTHMHVDVPMEILKAKDYENDDLRFRMKRAGYSAIGMTVAVDYVPLPYYGLAYKRFLNALDEYDDMLNKANLTRSLNADDVENNFTKGEPVVIQCVEGAHFVEGDISRIKTAYDRGLRVFCLLHDNDADPALGDVYTNEPKYGGLTDLGADVIRECERLGILVDLAHCDDETIKGALKVATKPIIITHTGLNTRLGTDEQMANMMYKRLISEETAKLVAENGGVIGLWPHLANSPKEYADNLDAMVKVVGIDNVCIGTDTKITKELNEREIVITEEMRKQFANQGNEDNKRKMPVQNLDAKNHIWEDIDDNFYHSIIVELVNLGYNKEDIEKMASGNFMRVFREATINSTF